MKTPVNSTRLNPLSVLASRIETMDLALIQGEHGFEIFDPERSAFLPVFLVFIPYGSNSVQLACRDLSLTVQFDNEEQARAVCASVRLCEFQSIERKSA